MIMMWAVFGAQIGSRRRSRYKINGFSNTSKLFQTISMPIKPQDSGDWAAALSRSTWHYNDRKPFKPCPLKKALIGMRKIAQKTWNPDGLTRFVALPFSVHVAALEVQ
jgi:hypothetical protein